MNLKEGSTQCGNAESEQCAMDCAQEFLQEPTVRFNKLPGLQQEIYCGFVIMNLSTAPLKTPI